MTCLNAISARRACLTGIALAALVASPGRAELAILDTFDSLDGWSTFTREGAHVSISPAAGFTGGGMRVDFDLNAAGGFVIVRKAIPLDLPPNYVFTLRVRGEAQANTVEFKLVDPDGKNVWWRRLRNFAFPTEWQEVVIRQSRLERAWGTSPKPLERLGMIELAIVSGSGGRGSVWIDDLGFEEREPAHHNGTTPVARASSTVAGHEVAAVLDTDAATVWRSEALPAMQTLDIDFGRNWEYGGLIIDWDPQDYATAYQVQVSHDGRLWTTAYRVTNGHGGRDYVYMPDAESHYVRLQLEQSSRGNGYAIGRVAAQPFQFSASPNHFFEAIAREAAPGVYPKYFYGRQTYWTVVGVNGDRSEGLLNEEGMLEAGGGFSLEPFLFVGGDLVTWNAVSLRQELEEGYLPIPSVVWYHPLVTLRVRAFAAGPAGHSVLYASYRVENHTDAAVDGALFLAIRPFQVSPPWQSLNIMGGVSPVHELQMEEHNLVRVNRTHAVVSLTRPDGFGAAPFEQGSVTDFLSRGSLPVAHRASDPFGFASAALSYRLALPPRQQREVHVAMPFGHDGPGLVTDGQTPAEMVARAHEQTRGEWQTLLNRVEFILPPAAREFADTLRTAIAYTLINRDGPAIQPGPRNYARSWIRDGAITSAALLEMGFTQEVREFVQWFARHQFADGKIPCCVDARGADPTPEHDGPGLFIYAVAAYYRYTRDVGFLSDMWPHVVRAVDYLAALRRTRLTEEYLTPDKLAYYGLLPESISHEGYSAYPVHSYWDDFFALRGLKDAADLAVVIGDGERAAELASLRDDFRRDLYASIPRAMAKHSIEYLPGSVELGDFDPTSTAVALAPGNETENLPQPALARTYELYMEDFRRRHRGGDAEAAWESYTGYEMRNAAALIRLRRREEAFEVLRFFIKDRRPAAWNEWGEISWRDPGAPRFVGDMPHTWVASGYVQALRHMIAYERESDRALVIAGGVPAAWSLSEEGVSVRRLPTEYGILNFRLRRDGQEALKLQLAGDLTLPPGKLVIENPLPQPLAGVRVNGTPVSHFSATAVTVDQFPAEIVLAYGAPVPTPLPASVTASDTAETLGEAYASAYLEAGVPAAAPPSGSSDGPGVPVAAEAAAHQIPPLPPERGVVPDRRPTPGVTE